MKETTINILHWLAGGMVGLLIGLGLVYLIFARPVHKYRLCDDSSFGGTQCIRTNTYTIVGNCVIADDGTQRVCGNYTIENNN